MKPGSTSPPKTEQKKPTTGNWFKNLVFSIKFQTKYERIDQIESEDWQCTAPGYKQTFCIHGVRHVETLPEHEEEGEEDGGGVDDEGVGAGQGRPGADLAKGREDQRENSA